MAGDAGGRPSTATVLFTDLARSTDLRRAMGDDRADDLRRRHDATIRSAAAEHLGEEIKGTGDGLMIVFPAAAEGVAGAVAIQRAITRLNRSLPEPLGVRVGLSAGDVSWEGDDCYGTPVVEASRLCAAADGGQILASEVVRLLAGSRGSHQLTSIGTLELKGLGDFTAYEVLWEPEIVSTASLPPALAPHETLRLIGRIGERDALVTAWKRALAGSTQVALIAGEPGVGKTRLAAELARQVHADGAVVLFGRCDEELSVPYQPFVEAIATYASGCADETLREHLGGGAGELARLVPSLAMRLPSLPEAMRADPETERFRLFEAVTGFVSSVATTAPVVLIVDDLHWAAKPTLLLLRHVVKQRSASRLLIICTYRDTDLGRGHPLSEVLADLRREPDVERVLLRGLDEGEVLEFVSTAAGHEADEALVRFAHAVHAETEGNPFFVGQVLRHLSETGALRMEDGRWVVTTKGPVGIPEGVREVIGKRLSQLGDEANEVLSVAAVIGREFDSQLLTEATGLEFDQVLDALEEAERGRLVLSVSGHDGRLTFAHALVRSTLYDEIPTTRRLRVHRRVAQALESRAAMGSGDRYLEELAHHCCEAAALGDIDSALRWSRLAAQAALDRVAYEEAAAQYERAIAVLDDENAAHQVEIAALRVLEARALRLGGANELSRTKALAAVELARLLERFDILLDAALVISGDRGWSEAGVVDEELVALLEEGLAALPPGDSDLRARAMARLAGELYFLETEADRRTALTDEALAMADRLGDPETQGFVLSCAAWGAWLPDNAAERLEIAREIVAMAERSGNRIHLATGWIWMIGCAAELGDRALLDKALANEVAAVEELGRPESLWTLRCHQAAVAAMECRWDDAEVLVNEAMQVGQVLSSETVLQMYGVGLFALARARGGIDALVPMVESMVAQYPLVPAWRCGLAYLYRELDMADKAREQFEFFAAEEFRNLPRDANWKVGVAILAAVAAMHGNQERAEQLYEMMLPVADTSVIAGVPADIIGSMHGPLGLLAATVGRWDDGEAHFHAAQEFNERMGNRAWTIYNNWEWARLLANNGDTERARPLLEDTIAEAGANGMPRIAGLASDLLAELDAR